MTQTRHGHHIRKTSNEDEDPNMSRARCGGPGMCKDCSQDAFLALTKPKKEQAVSDIQKYQHRVDEIEAVQITAENIQELAIWCNGEVIHDFKATDPSDGRHLLSVRTRQGEVELGINHWLIKNSTGRFEGMTDANFQQKYVVAQERREAVREAASHVHGFFGKPDAAWPNQ